MSGNRSGYATKQALCGSLKKKMEEKPLDKITIQEIVEGCGMNRQTFYYHFEDIYDQLKWMIDQEILIPLRERAGDGDDFWQDGFKFLLQYLDENRAIYLNVLRTMGYEEGRRFLYDDVYELCSMIADMLERQGILLGGHRESVIRSLVYLFAGLTLQWIQGKIEKTVDEVLEEVQYSIERFSSGGDGGGQEDEEKP